LITVPACAPCNQAFSKDDEYFLVILGSVSYGSALGKRVWNEKVLPTLDRTRALKGTLLSTLRQVEVLSPGGIHLGKAHAIGFSAGRMGRILAKIANGLLWHHAHVRLRDDTVVAFYEIDDVKVLSPFLPHLKANVIGDGSVVAYRYGVAPEDAQGTMWVIQFYGTKIFQILTLPCGSKNLPEHGKTYKELVAPPSHPQSGGISKTRSTRHALHTPIKRNATIEHSSAPSETGGSKSLANEPFELSRD
jgi:hypothetical protein